MAALRNDPETFSFGDALRAARTDRGWTLAELSDRLKAAGASISRATLSAWERGAYLPDLDSRISTVELTLGLPACLLTARLFEAAQARRDLETYDLRRLLPRGATETVTTAVDEVATVGTRGLIDMIEVEQRLRALRSGDTSYYFMHWEDSAASRVRVTAKAGCVVVGPPRRLAAGRMAVELRLTGGPLAAGEERAFRFQVHHKYFGAPEREDVHLRVATPMLESYVLRLNFPFATGDVLVRRCHWLDRHAPEQVERVEFLRGRRGTVLRWARPLTANAYGATWMVQA